MLQIKITNNNKIKLWCGNPPLKLTYFNKKYAIENFMEQMLHLKPPIPRKKKYYRK